NEGEEWSRGWGGSFAQWHFCVRPRIARHLPTGGVVEIATGYGRWAKYLIDEAASYTGFDLIEKCSKFCLDLYGGPNRKFVSNDGLHLVGVEDKSVDFIFSFDSLVHVDWPTLASYLSEIIRTLKPTGAAFIHHSNAGAVPNFDTGPAFRAHDVSAEK